MVSHYHVGGHFATISGKLWEYRINCLHLISHPYIYMPQTRSPRFVHAYIIAVWTIVLLFIMFG